MFLLVAYFARGKRSCTANNVILLYLLILGIIASVLPIVAMVHANHIYYEEAWIPIKIPKPINETIPMPPDSVKKEMFRLCFLLGFWFFAVI